MNTTVRRESTAELVMLLTGVIAVVVTFLLWSLSKSLGADFGITVRAAFLMFGGLVIAGGVWWTLYSLLGARGWAMTGTIFFAWLLWFCACLQPVLESMAGGGASPELLARGILLYREVPWYLSDLARYGVTATLVALIGWCLYQWWRDPYR